MLLDHSNCELPAKTMSPPLPRPLETKDTVPELSVVSPVYVLALLSVSTFDPLLVIPPLPEISPARVLCA